MPELNELNQPIGELVNDWTTPSHPEHEVMNGRYCRLEPLNPDRHTENLYESNALDSTGASWTYLPYGPFESQTQYCDWISQNCTERDPQFYAIIDLNDDVAVGVASYLRIKPNDGSIEVGHIHYSPRLQRTPAATEAMFLMMSHAFALGYRRFEWKCHALNAKSRSAAQRLGLSFEGVFRQATVMKGRNRDTAWFAAIDSDWSALQAAFTEWLSPMNFDKSGQQYKQLSALTAPILNRIDLL